MSTPAEEFTLREKRIADAVALGKPDRVPVMPLNCLYYATRVEGISNAISQRDYQKRLACLRKMTMDLNLDTAPPMFNLTPTSFFEIMGVTDFRWPGGDLDDDIPNQYVEKEYLKADEYDEYLSDPTTFTVKKLWPRFSQTMALLQDIDTASIPAVTTGWFIGQTVGPIVSQEPVMTFLKKMIQLGSEWSQYLDEVLKHIIQLELAGYPISWTGGVFPAFDIERSGTRREDLLLGPDALRHAWTIRRMADAMGGGDEAIVPLLDQMRRTRSNAEFLAALTRGG